MNDIIDILLAGELEHLNGFQITGEIKIPKEILAESITESIKNRKQKTAIIHEENGSDDLLKPNDYKKFLEFVDINEANVYFEGDDICVKIDIKK